MDMREKIISRVLELKTEYDNFEGIWVGYILSHNGLQKRI